MKVRLAWQRQWQLEGRNYWAEYGGHLYRVKAVTVPANYWELLVDEAPRGLHRTMALAQAAAEKLAK